MKFQISKLLTLFLLTQLVAMGREKAACHGRQWGACFCNKYHVQDWWAEKCVTGAREDVWCSEPIPCPSTAHYSLCSTFIVLEDELQCDFSFSRFLTPLTFSWVKKQHVYHILRNCCRENEEKDMAAELPQPFCELILLAIYFHTLVEKNEKSSIKKTRGFTPPQNFPSHLTGVSENKTSTLSRDRETEVSQVQEG